MAEISRSELVIVGGGPGGYAAAFLAADRGLQVTLIDASEKLGGACLFVGCIPSKALLHVAKLITEVRDAGRMGLKYSVPEIDLDGVRGFWIKTVENLAKNLIELAKRRKVEFVRDRAQFLDSNTLILRNGSRREFKNCIIAVGSSPSRLPNLNLESPQVMDSTAALRLERIPASLLVVGGGYIGLELGYVYAALGSKVTIVELTDGLLPGLDRDLVRPLQGRLAGLFDKIYLNTRVTNLSQSSKGIKATLHGDEIDEPEPIFDGVLIAVGRRPNSQGLGLDHTKVQINDRGFIQINDQCRTTDDAIFAIGDVAGEPMLAHKASHEGKVAVEAILGEPAAFDSRAVPAVVFTDPEVAWCGTTENDARRQKRHVKIARFPWLASGRAATLGRPEGLTKLVLDPETERVLGVGIVGPGAGELIGEGVLAVEMAASARDLALIIHPHPTLSETLGEAADSYFGTATHLLKKKA